MEVRLVRGGGVDEASAGSGGEPVQTRLSGKLSGGGDRELSAPILLEPEPDGARTLLVPGLMPNDERETIAGERRDDLRIAPVHRRMRRRPDEVAPIDIEGR